MTPSIFILICIIVYLDRISVGFAKLHSLLKFKVPNTRKKNTGLRLDFLKEVVSLHHGEIIVENREKGLRATLLFHHACKDV